MLEPHHIACQPDGPVTVSCVPVRRVRRVLPLIPMKITPVRGFLFAGALCALVIGARAQVIELRAAINAAQEPNNSSTSTATGSAIMLYDVVANTFDLIISISGMTNPATASHIHEGATGVNGSVVTSLGADAAYTRSGSTLTQTFRGVTHGGDKLTLIRGGAYFNIHSAQFPGGEIRGQLIARPVRLYANMDVAQEALPNPTVNFSGVNNFGGAVLLYDPTANTVTIRHSLYNFTSTFTNSHIHTGAPNVNGPVNTPLGNSPTAGSYNSNNGHISGNHDAVPYSATIADITALLTGGTYLNYHSQAFGGGQLRGRILMSTETLNTRLGNLSVRSFVGTGDQVLIGGISVQGTEPVRVLITAKGPSLTAFGVTGVVANPQLTLFDSASRQIAFNDDVGVIPANSELSRIPNVPTNPLESAIVVVLPPGNYTAIVSATAGTGVALLEAYDLRNLQSTIAVAALEPARAASPTQTVASINGKAGTQPELCVATPLVIVAAR